MQMKIKKLHPSAQVPGRATEGSAGFDLRACCEGGMYIAPGERALIPTGLSLELPGPEYGAFVFARSGLAYRQGLALANGVGVIDSDYRGELQVAVVNLSKDTIAISHGERVAQLVILPVCIPDMVELDELNGSDRGAGGFGSTGVE